MDELEDVECGSSSPRKRLDQFYVSLMKGIYRAEEAVFLDEVIGKNAELINENNFGNLFGSLQYILLDSIRLFICRIFEEQNRSYPLVSIPATLDFLEKNQEVLKIEQRPNLERILVEIGWEEGRLSQLKDFEVTNRIINFFRDEMQKPEFIHNLGKFKTIRDKVIAHSEDINISDLPPHTFEDMSFFIGFAKKFLSCIGFGYLSSAYECDGGYFPISDDAKRASMALKRLLKKAEIISDGMI